MPTPISTRTDKLFPYTTLFQSTYKPLNLLRSSRLLAFGRLTIAARVGSTWEHAIFARDPSFSSATKERRNALLDCCGDTHQSVAEAYKAAYLSMVSETGFHGVDSHFIGGAAGWAHVLFSCV